MLKEIPNWWSYHYRCNRISPVIWWISKRYNSWPSESVIYVFYDDRHFMRRLGQLPFLPGPSLGDVVSTLGAIVVSPVMTPKQREQLSTLKESVPPTSIEVWDSQANSFLARPKEPLYSVITTSSLSRGITSVGKQAKETILDPQRVSNLCLLCLQRFYEAVCVIIRCNRGNTCNGEQAKESAPWASYDCTWFMGRLGQLFYFQAQGNICK